MRRLPPLTLPLPTVAPPSLTLGVEEEYQVVEPETGELASHVPDLLEDGGLALDNIHPELHTSTLEVATEVCTDLDEVGAELRRLRREVRDLVGANDLTILSAGAHPFASGQTITPLARFRGIEEDMADLARRTLTFGLHVHVGLEDRALRIDVMNAARYFLPHLLALSTSSPFWQGRKTGLKSYRSVVWENFPRTGVPPRLDSWASYERMIGTLVETGCLEDGTKLWWDLRPSWHHPTLEFRVCDTCPRRETVLCLVGLIQALVLKLWRLRRANLSFRRYPKSLVDENKWRALRYGLDGQLVDFGRQEERPARALIRELIEGFLTDPIDELGVRPEVEYAYEILEGGTSADRQLELYEETGDLGAVVEQLVSETNASL